MSRTRRSKGVADTGEPAISPALPLAGRWAEWSVVNRFGLSALPAIEERK